METDPDPQPWPDLDLDADLDPHSEKLLDPDPHKVNADPHSTALVKKPRTFI